MTRIADPYTLGVVASTRAAERRARVELRQEMEVELNRRLQRYTEDVEEAVLDAQRAGNTVMAIATAYVEGTGYLPNRPAIYAILNKYAEDNAEQAEVLPFRWEFGVPFDGTQGWEQDDPQWRIVLDAEDFGPERINGHFEWQPLISGYVIPQIYSLTDMSDEARYPVDRTADLESGEVTRGYYQATLWQWRNTHPIPDGED